MENIYNCIAIVEDPYIEKVAIKVHTMDGTDEEKENFLKSKIEEDIKDAKHYPVSENFIISNFGERDRPGILYDHFKAIRDTDDQYLIFYGALEELKAPNPALMNVSVYKNGEFI